MRAWSLALLLFLIAPAHAQVPGCAPADCVQVLPPMDVPIIVGDVAVRSYEVTAHVVDGIATVDQRLVVENPGAVAAELVANFPLAPGAAVLSFELVVDGQVFTGEVKERSAARQTYEEAQAEARDAILLARADERLLELSANVAPGEPRELRLSSVFQVPTVAGSRVLRLPVSLLDEVDEVTAHVELRDRYGMQDVAFPEAPLERTVDSTQHVVAGHHTTGPMADVVAVWREDASEWDVRALASHGGQDAAVLLRIDHRPTDGAVLPRDVAFVIDVSGSMNGHKIEDARNALATALGMLRQGDRFTVHAFNTETTELTQGLSGLQDVAAMRDAVRALEAGGGTDLHGGLLGGLQALPAASERAQAVILLSDGLPTAGVRDHQQIVADAVAHEAAVHVVAIGVDADRTFLRDVADQTGGSITIMQPGEGDLEARLVQLFAELDRPVARDVQLTFEGITPRHIMPPTVPLLYEGRTASILMRADLGATWNVRLTATTPTGAIDDVFQIKPADIEMVPEVESLWGAAWVEALLAQQRAGSEDPQVLQEAIIEAAVRYGVVTPHTSWVVVGPPAQPMPAHDATTHYAQSPAATMTQTMTQTTGTGQVRGLQNDVAQSDEEAATPGPAIGLLLVALLALARRK